MKTVSCGKCLAIQKKAKHLPFFNLKHINKNLTMTIKTHYASVKRSRRVFAHNSLKKRTPLYIYAGQNGSFEKLNFIHFANSVTERVWRRLFFTIANP